MKYIPTYIKFELIDLDCNLKVKGKIKLSVCLNTAL